jgi:hypothetical protein
MLMQVCEFQKCSIKCKNFDFKIETSQSNQQKKRKQTLANYSNIKPTLQAIGEYLKRMKFQ